MKELEGFQQDWHQKPIGKTAPKNLKIREKLQKKTSQRSNPMHSYGPGLKACRSARVQCCLVPTLRQGKVKREFLWHGYGRTFVTVQVTVEARGEEAKGCQTDWLGRIMPFTDRFFSRCIGTGGYIVRSWTWQKRDSRG